MTTEAKSQKVKVNHTLNLQHNPLLRVIAKYKFLHAQPKQELNEFFHYHEKNPDALHQIKLLEQAEEYIQKHLKGEAKDIARLGFLLTLQALLNDPNREGHIYNYVSEKLQLEKTIEKHLKHMKAHARMDLTSPRFLNLRKKSMLMANEIIDKISDQINVPKKFLKDVTDTLLVELEYNDKVLISLGRKPKP